MILGVDRLDYTKGIELRLQAFRELLEEGKLHAPETALVQVATPSRERVEHYELLRTRVEREVGRINGQFASVGEPAVHYLNQSYDRAELVALYCAADVMMVTPYRDGMNLVAKEYVAARIDNGGALVLSELPAQRTSSARVPLQPARPGRCQERADAGHPGRSAEGRRRMQIMQRYIRAHDVDRWAQSFLSILQGHEGQE